MLRKLYFSTVFGCIDDGADEAKEIENNDLKDEMEMDGRTNEHAAKAPKKKCSNNKKTTVERRKSTSSQLENVRDNFIYYPFSIWFHFVLAISWNICCCNQTPSTVYFHMFVISRLTHSVAASASDFFFLSHSTAVISLFVEFMSWFTLPVTPFHNLSYTLSNSFD